MSAATPPAEWIATKAATRTETCERLCIAARMARRRAQALDAQKRCTSSDRRWRLLIRHNDWYLRAQRLDRAARESQAAHEAWLNDRTDYSAAEVTP